MRYAGGSYGTSSDLLEQRNKPLDEKDDFEEYKKIIIGEFGGSINSKKDKPISQQRNRKSYVYLLKVINETSLYKIGRATDVNNRLRTFNVKLPFQVEYECVIESGDMFRLERELHRLFAEKRLQGEFFRLEETDVSYICRCGENKDNDLVCPNCGGYLF